MESEAVSELLSRLPAKSLLRFESVSKGWRDLISDDTLRRLQCHRVKAVISGFFFQTTMAFPCPTPVKYVNINNDQAVVQDTILDFLPEKVEIVASSNGLLCCHRNQELGERVDNLIYVCNPSKKEYVQIEWPDGNDNHQYVALAFNPFRYPVDDLANFKVVSMSKEGMLTCLFHVYSSKSKEWRKLDVYKFGYDNRISWPDGQVVFASGVLYWLTNGNILGFDVETEQPYFISLPVERIHKNSGLCEVCIGESEGRLHLIVICKAGLRVWILGDGQKWVVKHWVSLSRIEKEYPHFLYTDAKINASLVPTNIVIPTWIEPVVYKDEILLIKLRHYFSFENKELETGTKMYLYNFDTRKMEELFNIDKLGSCTGFLNAVPYSMSLAPLGSA
ncbi:hypothetical protein IFM89_002674 [Coptis chinensis]|uniref:F-box domain-containing protein n=1 Tax=Coptis chinensis TaxID=261450 RepID=A0A835MCK7_9MAGN|nr:hypothetical protein IFM89_002674 [Coptis chinensis]